jgi:transcriptional regulator with XRE-family HTH domain
MKDGNCASMAKPSKKRPVVKSQSVYGRGSGIPHPIDVYVGKRIRMRRLFLGWNQSMLASRLGLTFQQVQKYEKGSNRVSASRLSATANVMGVPISYFFAGLNSSPETPDERLSNEQKERPEAIELIRFYYAIPDDNVRRQLLTMAKAIAAI